MEEKFEFFIETDDVSKRIDTFLSENFEDFSRSSIQRLIQDENVYVNNSAVSKNYRLKNNDIISVVLPEPKELDIVAQNIPLDIVYEDSDLLVVNKPKGMVVHPAAGNYENTLVNALLYHCKDTLSGINGIMRPGIVHRIDKNTSGLLIVAKSDVAHRGLALQIKEHSFKREYEAVLYGRIKDDKITVNQPIGRNKVDRKKMCVTYTNSKSAVTHIHKLELYKDFTHVKCVLETGRTHQIRVHTAYIGHPVAGDDVYGPKRVIKSLNGQCLHAKTIGFIHPVTGKEMYFSTDLPDYFDKFLNSLSKQEV